MEKGRAEGLVEGEQREQRGEQRGKVEVVEGFLRVGVAWDVIEAATGLTEAGFQELVAYMGDGTGPQSCLAVVCFSHIPVALRKRNGRSFTQNGNPKSGRPSATGN